MVSKLSIVETPEGKKQEAFLKNLEALEKGKKQEIQIKPIGYVDQIKQEIKDGLDNIVIGQEDAKKVLLDIIGAKLFSNKPNKKGVLGTALFIGPTGVGKTQLAEALGEVLLGSEEAITLIEGETFQSEYAISKLIGSSPGYIGYGDTPILADTNIFKHYYEARIKKKLHKTIQDKENFSIVIIDEFEKMHPNTRQFFLNVLSNGEVKMATGKDEAGYRDKSREIKYSKITNLRNTIFIFTTNAGTNIKSSSIGFGKSEAEAKKDLVEKEVKRTFSKEFLGRINRNIVFFNELSVSEVKEIISLRVQKIQNENLEGYENIKLAFDKSAVDYLIKHGYNKDTGARQLTNTIDAEISSEIDKLVFENMLDLINHPVILTVKMIKNQVKITLKNDSKRKKKKDTKIPYRSVSRGDIIKGGEVVLPLHNGSLLYTHEKISEFMMTYMSLYKLRDLNPLSNDYTIELEYIEKNLLMLGFSDRDIEKMKEMAISSILEDYYNFIQNYQGLIISNEVEKKLFHPMNWTVVRSIIKRKVKEFRNKKYNIELIVKELEEALCEALGVERLSGLQMLELTKLVHIEHINNG